MELSRLKLLTNEQNIKKIANTNVLVIGLGGVGGYIVEALVRSGIEKITIIDGDVIEKSNLNRQVLALNSTIGQDKTCACEKRIKDINPNCVVNKLTTFLTINNIDIINFQNYDYVLDACDTISVKKEIIKKCSKLDSKFISCMGTGNKFRPEMLEITDIRNTCYDPIAKIIRKMIKEENIKNKITVVSSKETPIKTNSNIIGSNSFVPATAGMLMASYVINDIIGN